jgi:hypothetical protein
LLFLAAACSPVARGSLSIYVSPEDLASRTELVVEGRVVRTASGFDPEDGSLATYVTLRVQNVVRGKLATDTIVIREPGGRFGDLVHELDAVPTYEAGEDVLVFLEPSADGALRTAGMFFGKFVIAADGPRGARVAHRDLGGQGIIFGRVAGDRERIPLSDLESVIASVPRGERDDAPRAGRSRYRGGANPTTPARRAAAEMTPVPVEFSRLRWDGVRVAPDGSAAMTGHDGVSDPTFAEADQVLDVEARFVSLSSDAPARWYQADSGQAVRIDIERGGNPLGDGPAAVAEMQRAVDAWTNVPESRLVLEIGDDDYDYTGHHSSSPTDYYSGKNVILFDDPYNDISDPINCSGVLAIGGYWRSGSEGAPVNNVEFYPALQLYVIFNDNFECYLSDPDDLAEVATHELGHGIGFGHSDAPDAIMRSFAYGGRGPRLGADDQDGAHCHYPHTLQLIAPDGGEAWEAGSVRTIRWSITAEQGPDAGTVDLEYSIDGGQTWNALASGVANDGTYDWLLPGVVSDAARIRVVRPHRDDFAPQIFPSACSDDASAGNFSITAPVLVAGSIPATPDGGLRIDPAPYGDLRLSWEPSCSDDVGDHAIYEGSLDALRAGTWDHVPLTCSAGVDLTEYVFPGAGSRYYLVAPLAGGREGALGADSSAALRPVSAQSCAPREADSTCE